MCVVKQANCKTTHRQQRIHSFSTHQLQHYTIMCAVWRPFSSQCHLIYTSNYLHTALNCLSEIRTLTPVNINVRCTLRLHAISSIRWRSIVTFLCSFFTQRLKRGNFTQNDSNHHNNRRTGNCSNSQRFAWPIHNVYSCG